jgi:hypothetical protein
MVPTHKVPSGVSPSASIKSPLGVVGVKSNKLRAVVPVQARGRAYPQESGVILQQAVSF